MHWGKATTNHGRPSPILSLTQLQLNLSNTDTEGTARNVRIKYDVVTLMTPLTVLSVQ